MRVALFGSEDEEWTDLDWSEFVPDSTAPAMGGAGWPAFPTETGAFYRVLLAFGADPTADPETWLFTDVSPYVREADKVRYTHGRRPKQPLVPSTLAFSLNSPGGRFSKRNALGPYFGLLNQDVPVRVEINVGTGWFIRWTGFVSKWPPKQDTSGNHKYVRVRANGTLHRLTQGKRPLQTPAYRGTQIIVPVAYWSLNTGSLVTEVLSELSNFSIPTPGSAVGHSMVVSGTVRFGAVEGWPGSPGNFPEFFGAQNYAGGLKGAIEYTGGGAGYSVDFWFKLGRSTEATDTSIGIARWSTSGTFGGKPYDPAAYTGGFAVYADHFTDGTEQLTVAMYHPTGPLQSLQTPDTVRPMDGNWHHCHVEIDQLTPSLVRSRLYYDGTLYATEDSATFIVAGQPTSFSASWYGTWNPTLLVFLEPFTSLSIGEIAVYAQPSLGSATYEFSAGHIGESPIDRFIRLSDEENTFSVVNDPYSSPTESMGPQGVGRLVDELESTEGASAGFLDEDQYSRLRLSTVRARYNRSVELTLNKAAGHLMEPFDPTESGPDTRNVWSIDRPYGPVPIVAVRSDGSLGTDSIGVYDDQATLNVETDDQCRSHAERRVALGTVDELRVDSVSFNLAASPELIPQWLSCDVGSRFQITNPTDDLQQHALDQIVEGFEETLSFGMWEVELFGFPSSPYEVFALDSTDGNRGRLASDSSMVTTAVASGDTSMSVTVPGILWETGAQSTQIFVHGELMTVTNVTGASSPQTFTVTRTVAKTIPAGASVSLFRPATLAL